jgi:hypothetical protein
MLRRPKLKAELEAIAEAVLMIMVVVGFFMWLDQTLWNSVYFVAQ